MASVADRYDFIVRWEPYQIRPGVPDEGILKPPSTPDNPRVGAQMKAIGQEVNIDFTGLSDRVPNTLPCHALLHYAKETDGGSKQNDLKELMLQAYFTDGVFYDTEVLVKMATDVGLDANKAREVVTSEARIKEALEEVEGWRKKGVRGVPHYIMNGKHTFSGNQNEAAFLKAFEDVTRH